MKRHYPLFALVAFGIAFIMAFYGSVVLNPNSIAFHDQGDAIKNYFTYAYYIKHDTSFIHSSAMNYPFGEHFLYTDCHPVLAAGIKVLASGFPTIADYSIGILNLVMISSIFLTFLVCYYLLVEFKVDRWLAVIFAIGITLLAPQIFRLSGHFSLSYSVAIPLSWLLTAIVLRKQGDYRPFVFLFINNLFWLFLNAYLGVIILFFTCTLLICHLATNRHEYKKFKSYSMAFISMIVPLLIYYFFSALTDYHVGRTTSPSGFFQYYAELDDIFLPHHQPFRSLFHQLTGTIIKQEWEAWSYVGIATTFLFVVLLTVKGFGLFQSGKRWSLSSSFGNPVLRSSFIAAILVLLFAMVLPFHIFPELLDLIPIVKQFRATGRFAWPFYFAAIVLSSVIIHQVFHELVKRKKRYIALGVVVVFTSLNIAEAMPYHIQISSMMGKSKNFFSPHYLPAEYKACLPFMKNEQYQAILALPFFHQGSEVFTRTAAHPEVRTSMILSYHSGLPMINAQSARISIPESKKIIQLLAPDFYEKEITRDFSDPRPILVVRTSDDLTRYEQKIIAKSRLIKELGTIGIYALKMEELFRNNGNSIQMKFDQIRSQPTKKNSFFVSDTLTFIFYDDFEIYASSRSFRGIGAYESAKKGVNTFAVFSSGTFDIDKEYHLSIWMHNGELNALNMWFRLIVEEYNNETGNRFNTTIFPDHAQTIVGDWSLVEGKFRINDSRNVVKVYSIGKENSRAGLIADDLLIHDEGTDVYKYQDNGKRLFYNNHDIILK